MLAARMQKKQWVIEPAEKSRDEFAKSLKVSLLLAQVLINRQITDTETAKIFLQPKLTDLIAPEKTPGIEKAVQRISKAVKDKEKVTVYGDYDVDGITGVAILWQLLTMLGVDVDFYIPHRIDEGYGLNADAIRSLAKTGTKLLITVDCGAGAIESAQLADQLGIELIITDHHQFGPELPKAFAIVHPALEPAYSNQNASGSMVAFKLAWAVANEFNSGTKLQPQLRDFMLNATSLAAMGTIADVVDLRGENRVLTSYGLKTLPKCQHCGIDALIESAGLTGQGLDSFHIGFRLAPMLNAAGRMGHARLAVELLTTESPTRAKQIAEYLKEQNDQRRTCERKIFKQACEMIVQQGLNHPDRKSIVLACDQWHTGVIGIVASRVIDKFYRPTILINTANGIAQGSARSIEGFDLLKAISTCSEYLNTFGGHKMAAGITLDAQNIPMFAQQLENYAGEHLNYDDIVAKLNIDAVTSLEAFNKLMVTQLQMLEPFGRGNPEPVFATMAVQLASAPRRVGAKGDHLQLAVTDRTAAIRCIGFRMGKLEKKLLEHEHFNIAYHVQLNTFNGNTNIQLVLKDVRFE